MPYHSGGSTNQPTSPAKSSQARGHRPQLSVCGDVVGRTSARPSTDLSPTTAISYKTRRRVNVSAFTTKTPAAKQLHPTYLFTASWPSAPNKTRAFPTVVLASIRLCSSARNNFSGVRLSTFSSLAAFLKFKNSVDFKVNRILAFQKLSVFSSLRLQ